MKRPGIKACMIVFAAVFLAAVSFGVYHASTCRAGAAEGFLPEKWWPSKYGPEDNRGANNLITPDVIMTALKIPKTGKIYRLALPYTNHMPLPWGRTYSLTIPGLPTGGPYGKQGVVWNDEFLVGEIAQVGTQFDGLGHIGMKDKKDDVFRWYNGVNFQQYPGANSHGLKRLGPEHMVPYVTRGVLIDAAGLKGVKTMKPGEAITLEDLETCMKNAGIAPLKKGDAVLFNTGWIEGWEGDPKIYNAGEPGVDLKVIKYLADKEVSIVGADTWGALDVVPAQDPDYPFPSHCYLECVNGIGQLQNLDLRELAKDKVYEFLFVFAPIPLEGATGSPVSAFAIR
ncbi:MAG: cyclase family protein [Syntrophobacteraceae bacterium]|jgi:kynurenine formamidase